MRWTTTPSTRNAVTRITVAAAAVGVAAAATSVVLATTNGGGGTAASAVSSDPPRRVIVARRFLRPWRASCISDACTITTVVRVPLRTLAADPSADIVVTATIGYRTRYSSRADAYLLLRRGQELRHFKPGTFVLTEAPRGTTATLTWALDGVAARGRAYAVDLVVASRGGAAGRSFVAGNRLTLVIDQG